MEWIPVVSSNLNAIYYDAADSTIYINFKNGTAYAYPNTSIELFNDLLSAPSKGQFHHLYIKHLPYRRIS
ncbi:KTSC domain-containing protein [Weissella viridescens]|uniref:KTSC domain-containing protein n=1 Tax=Weissella viridescens TaxID=1629 RepID=UPI0035A89B08